jgi:hypothetical protein
LPTGPASTSTGRPCSDGAEWGAGAEGLDNPSRFHGGASIPLTESPPQAGLWYLPGSLKSSALSETFILGTLCVALFGLFRVLIRLYDYWRKHQKKRVLFNVCRGFSGAPTAHNSNSPETAINQRLARTGVGRICGPSSMALSEGVGRLS